MLQKKIESQGALGTCSLPQYVNIGGYHVTAPTGIAILKITTILVVSYYFFIFRKQIFQVHYSQISLLYINLVVKNRAWPELLKQRGESHA